MLDSLRRLQRVEPGFGLEDRLVVTIGLSESQYPGPHDVAALFEGLVERVATLPAVRAAGTVTHAPLSGDDWTALQVVQSAPLSGSRIQPRWATPYLGGVLEQDGIPARRASRVAPTEALRSD